MKSLLLAVIGLLCGVSVSAQNYAINGILYTSYGVLTHVEVVGVQAGINFTNINIPRNITIYTTYCTVKRIGEGAFAGCNSAKSITLPNSVVSIGAYAFSGCTELTNFEIPNGVQIIEESTFKKCTSLSSITIPNSITSIKDKAFEGCAELSSVIIPNSVNSLGNEIFDGCTGLNSVISYIPEDKLFPVSSFGDINESCILYVPYGAKETYATTEGWNVFENIVEMNPTDFSLIVSDAGYATLYLDYSTEIPEGVEVYTAKEVDGNVLKMELVEDVLPANTGVVVKAPAGTYPFAYSDTDAPAIADNLFMGSAKNTYIDVPSNSKAFVLSKVDGEVGMYLAKLTDGRFLNNANKAYLLLDGKKLGLSDEELDTSVGGAQLSLRFNFGGATSIDNLPATVTDGNVIYDLYGRKVNSVTTPGLYIVNGKKVWVK